MILSKSSEFSLSGPSKLIRIVSFRVSSPSLLLSRVLISFMSLKLRSTVAVVTGKTTASLAKDARFGKPATKALLAKKVVTIF